MNGKMAGHLPGRGFHDGKYAALFSTLLFTSMFVMCSRGLFEILAGKAVAYVLQLVVWSMLIAACLISRHARPTARLSSVLFFVVIFVASGLISSLITVERQGVLYGFAYVFVFLYISIILSFFSGFYSRWVETAAVTKAFVFMGLLLAVVGIFQQLGMINLPGGSAVALLRPSSLTGSYLHYPIIVALLALSMMQIYVATGRWRYIVYAIFMMIAIFTSFSRSGMSIVMGGIGIFYAMYYIRQNIEVKTILYVGAFLSIPVIIVLAIIFAEQSAILERVVSIVDLQSGGNSKRSEIWTSTISVFMNGPIIFGDQAGLYTNITNNLLGGNALVAESGFLQHLVNVGLIGCLSFYALFIFVYRAVDPNHLWLRAAVMTAALQSFIYQSIEVFPYMAILGLMPVLSRHLTATEQERLRRKQVPLPLSSPAGSAVTRSTSAE